MTASGSPFKAPFQVLFFLFFIGAIAPFQSFGQVFPDTQEDPPAEEEIPEDRLGRRTPRGTVAGFIDAVAEERYLFAGEYFSLTEGTDGEQIALLLQSLMDHNGEFLPYSFISDDTTGRTDDQLPTGVDRVGSFQAGGESYPLLLKRKMDENGYPIWMFSSETVNNIEKFGAMADHSVLIDQMLPEFLQDRTWGGVPVGEWLAMLLFILLAYLLSWSLIRLILHLTPRIWKRAGEEPIHGVMKAFALPVIIYLAVWLFVMISQEVGISIIVRQKFSGITLIMGLVALLILLWRLTDFVSDFSKKRMSLRGHISWVSIILFLKRAAKVAIIVFGVIAILGAFGVNVTAGLAALGIGGIALALGAQKTVENFVGSVTLVTDQPVRVGDFCKVGDTVGTVEQIGMRSTRIRTLDRTLITIPNGEFSAKSIENYAHRDRFWFHPVLGLRYETTPDQLRFLLVELRAILYAHPKVENASARVRFISLGADSLNLEVFSYITVLTYDEFLEVQEDLLLRMMDKVAESGTGFAFPSQTLYFAKDQGLESQKSKEAEQKVRQWREKGEMPLPQFNQQKIEELSDTIPYPPEGSSIRKKSDS